MLLELFLSKPEYVFCRPNIVAVEYYIYLIGS